MHMCSIREALSAGRLRAPGNSCSGLPKIYSIFSLGGEVRGNTIFFQLGCRGVPSTLLSQAGICLGTVVDTSGIQDKDQMFSSIIRSSLLSMSQRSRCKCMKVAGRLYHPFFLSISCPCKTIPQRKSCLFICLSPGFYSSDARLVFVPRPPTTITAIFTSVLCLLPILLPSASSHCGTESWNTSALFPYDPSVEVPSK